jgi:hypothetical protein
MHPRVERIGLSRLDIKAQSAPVTSEAAMKMNLITGAAQTVTDTVERGMDYLKDRSEPRPKAKPASRRWSDREKRTPKTDADEK